MRSKIYFLCFTLLIIISPWAFSQTPTPFNGAYAGGALGGSLSRTNKQLSASADVIIVGGLLGIFIPVDVKDDMVGSSPMAALFAGYGHTWQRFYLGSELALDASHYLTTDEIQNGLQETTGFGLDGAGQADIVTRAKISPVQFAVALRPGYLLTPKTLLYGRIAARTSLVSNTDVSAIVTVGTDVVSSTQQVSPFARKLQTTLQLGGGLEQSVNEHWSVRMDYVYSNYGKLHTTVTNTVLMNVTPPPRPCEDPEDHSCDPSSLVVKANNSAKISSHLLTLGVTYHFDA